MCFLFLDGEFSATALLSETARIKNTYTDGTYLCACIIKYICPRRCTVFAILRAIRGSMGSSTPTALMKDSSKEKNLPHRRGQVYFILCERVLRNVRR